MYHSKLITMLQLGGTFSTASIRLIPRTSWRFTELFSTSSAVNSDTVLNSTKENNDNNINKIEVDNDIARAEELGTRSLETVDSTEALLTVERIKGKLVRTLSKDSPVAEEIKAAKSIPDILNVTRSPDVNTNDVVKIISTVTDYTQNKHKMENAEQQAFAHVNIDKRTSFTSEVLQYIKTPEDIARISNLQVDQCVQVLSLLRAKRKRDVSTLKEVANQISKEETVLTINQSMNTLYSMASLNFPDEILLNKVSSDLLQTISTNDKPFVLDSILTSIGMLRYKNDALLKELCKCVYRNKTLQATHFLTLLQTLAVVGYKDQDVVQFIQDKIYPLEESDMCGASEWVNLVWSLAVLDEVQPKHLSSVLNENFVSKLQDVNTSVVKFVKLLNINGVARTLRKDYKGPFLDEDSHIYNISLSMSREKHSANLVMAETLRNIFPSASYYNVNVNSKMGFMIDAECAIDKNYEPVPIDSSDSNTDFTRIAIIKYEYQDYCRGDRQLKGIVKLHARLLRESGYKLLIIPLNLFKKKDKLVDRTKYIHDSLKIVASESP